MRKNDLEGLREELDNLKKQVNKLEDVLLESQLIGQDHFMGRKYFHSNLLYLKQRKRDNEKMKLILDHLGLDFEWIECKPHYELKEKKEEE